MGVTFSDPSVEKQKDDEVPDPNSAKPTDSHPVDDKGDISDPPPEDDRDAAKAALIERLSGDTSSQDSDIDPELSKELDAEDEDGDKPEPEATDDPALKAGDPTGEVEDTLPDELTDAEQKTFTPNANARIRKIIHQRNEARTELETYRAVEKRYADLGVKPEVRKGWDDMGLAMQQLPPLEAGEKLARMAQNLGWQPPAQDAQKPSLDLSEGAFADLVEELIDDNEISKSAWRQLKAALRENLESSKPAEPAPSAPPVDSTADQTRRQTEDFQRQTVVNRVSTEMAATYGERWGKMVPDIQKEIDGWGDNVPVAMMEKIARDAVSRVAAAQLKAEQAAKTKAVKTTKTPKTSLRSSDGQRTVHASTGDARTDGKNDLLERMNSGQVV